tara:strand:- start:2086 stop:2727 length:642 start_codon:yes stop_codon:yes gene_type:complete
MDEDIAIVNQETRVTLIKNFFKNNFKKILIIIITVLIILISFFSIEEIKKRKKNKLAEAYNTIIFNSDKFSELEIKEKMIKIVNSKVNTYSALALYYLIDNNIINDDDEIKDLFDIVISINKDLELKNLVIFKKALYFSDKFEEVELLKILNPVLNSESIWKQHGLLLMGDFYFHKNQMNKAKEFFQKITELSNVNPKLRIEVEKRLNRDFSE